MKGLVGYGQADGGLGTILILGTIMLLVTFYIIAVRWGRQEQLRKMQDEAIERNFKAQFGDDLTKT